jgi:uncharacterized protein
MAAGDVSRVRKRLLRIGLRLAAIYTILLSVLFSFQDRLIYFPRTDTEPHLLYDARVSGLEPWRDARGQLIGWRRPAPAARCRAVLFHGNAGCAMDRAPFADALGGLSNGQTWEVHLFEYPGYGARPGTPSRKPIEDSARAALGELLAADSRPLFLLGESIGSGPACSLAAEFGERIAGVGLIVPMSSIADAAAHHYPFVPVRRLLRGQFDNVAALRAYRGRVAFVLAGEDEIVTTAAGMRLHDSYGGPKFLRVLPGVGHNGIDQSPDAPWWREMSDFLTAGTR